ncbi:hypothetical protein MSTO_01310 [Mycobacterium stomatepiae]|uniref:DUF732 domain-containing protein n=1 Tax=Mycobacterium stomatepiae TaxID=470076 RepID=A0A7I7Q1P1_9MYCO|nr:DUF732 domain-containing protein [Mycobacterium stomatepiae]BBY19926.1 hypothetical protein MSTO_01310 [Mycobacterium stomatepiae]
MSTRSTRFTGITSKVSILTTAIVFLSGAATLRGGAAIADSNEDHFLTLLASEDIPALEGVPSLIDTAHKVCHALDTGTPANRVVDALVDYAVSNDPSERQYAPGRLTRTEARFVLAAVGAYCPYDQSKLAVLVTRPSSRSEPTHPAAKEIRLSDFEVHATTLASVIEATPPAGITDPDPPQIPPPSPPVGHLRTPPLPVAAPPRPQQSPARPQQPPIAPPPAAPAPVAPPPAAPAPVAPPPAAPAPVPPPPAPPASSAPPMAPGFVKLAP